MSSAEEGCSIVEFDKLMLQKLYGMSLANISDNLISVIRNYHFEVL